MRTVLALLVLGAALAGPWSVQAKGVSLAVTPASGACTDQLAVHASGLQPGVEVYLFASSASGADRELITFASPSTNWDFEIPSGVRYLCDEFADPAMDITLWLSDGSNAPRTLLASTTFMRTAPDAVAAGPVIAVTPPAGPCNTPAVITSRGFPPGASIDLAVGPLFTLPGSGGGGIGMHGGTAAADGSFESTVLVTTGGDGRPAASPSESVFAIECSRVARMRIMASPSRSAASGYSSFNSATTVFRRGVIAAPAVGTGTKRRDTSETRWLLAGGIAVSAAAAVGAAWVRYSAERRPAHPSRNR